MSSALQLRAPDAVHPHSIEIHVPFENGNWTIRCQEPKSGAGRGMSPCWRGFKECDFALARKLAAAPELVDALNGLYGLLQLFAARDDVPPEVKNFATNHRAIDALAVLAKVQP